MNIQEEYRLSQYQDLGILGTKQNIRLKRNKKTGLICVEKRVPLGLEHIYSFLKEQEIPYIPKIYESIVDQGELVIIEEYISGQNLEDILQENLFSEEKTIRIIKELCNVLRILHNANPSIICRDLKAENIMINEKQEIKLVDFNIARTFVEGKNRDTVLLGTAEYAAPEQFGYFQTDNRTDIYSLGILINYMRTGKFPVEKILSGKLEHIVRKCICMEPKDRYQNVDELLEHLYILYPEQRPEEKIEKDNYLEDSYIIPGFRSRSVWKMCIAIMGYILITMICFRIEIQSENAALTETVHKLEQCTIWLSQIAYVFIVCNYRNIRTKTPILRSNHLVVRIMGYILLEFLLLIVACFICIFFENVLI